MKSTVVGCVHHLIEEYRRFLLTSYRFLDNHLRQQFEGHLAQANVVVKGPYVTLAREYESGETLRALTEGGRAERDLLKIRWPFGEEKLYRHQVRALDAGRAGRSFVITTGTGSGKTESFLLPIFDDILRRKREGVTGVQAILIYPMNALANDQLERLRRMLGDGETPLSFALYTGDSDASSRNLREPPAPMERTTRAEIRRNPPDILLTNYKQLEFLLVRLDDRVLFTPSLKHLVLDELHSYRGALATEIACLIRRLKAHAGIPVGGLLGIATSATVASGEEAHRNLAEFATTLFGEPFQVDDVIGETFLPLPATLPSWVPPPPDLDSAQLFDLDPDDDAAVAELASRLTGRPCLGEEHIADRLTPMLRDNAVVALLERVFSRPAPLSDAVRAIQEHFPDRARQSEERLRREVEAYLLVASIGDEEHPPRLRPKLHTFFHGVYDVALCMNPECRSLVPQGGTECPRCGSVARPAALCRTCGQDFAKVRFEKEGDDLPIGTGDFYSDDRTVFLTHQIHRLPEAAEYEEEEGAEDPPKKRRKPRIVEPSRQEAAEEAMEAAGLCISCGRVLPSDRSCTACNQPVTPVRLHRGPLHTCPACGDIYTRGDIVTPLRTGSASSVSILIDRHLARVDDKERKLLVFADNRQDVAHQAGYTSDKHRSFALRHFVAHQVRNAGEVYLEALPDLLFDEYRKLGYVPPRTTRYERDRWREALSYESANEFSRYVRQRASLENLGLVEVDYEFLEDLGQDDAFQSAARQGGLDVPVAIGLVRAMLDVMRRHRAVDFDFFREYIDPNRVKRYRELEAEPFCIRLPDRDRKPNAFALGRPDHIRKSGRLMGFYQENPRAGQMTAVQKIAARIIGDRERAEIFLRTVVPIMERIGLLVHISTFPIPRAERMSGLRPLQIARRVIRLRLPERGYRCNACQVWRPYIFPVCPTPKCERGSLQADRVDENNYYVRLYVDQPPRRLAVSEHSAQISAEDRARRESDFKDGRLNVLVCSPTLELGVDIGPLITLVLRNAPPTPANYAQRVGRAGRRLRIGFVSTFCAGGSHDRNAFDDPQWLIAGQFDPPNVRLDNPRIVHRHLRSFVLENLEAQIPARLGDLLDDLRSPTRWEADRIAALFAEVEAKRAELISVLGRLFARDREEGRISRYDEAEASRIVDAFESDLRAILERWWRRVEQLKKEYDMYSEIGTPRNDKKKAAARERAYREITHDPERAYILNYLSTQGFLPAYQFPIDTFSLDPGVSDTPTLYRASAIAIEEFAPGNYVYANGHKLRSIRVLYAGGPGGGRGAAPARTDAEASGRLQSFQFCDRCEEVVEETRNTCPRCGADLPSPVDAVFVDAFEAEESLRIGSDEESRQRQYHVRRESLLTSDGGASILYPYDFAPLEYRNLADILVTNWGKADSKTGEPHLFRLCPDCGRHLPNDPNDPTQERSVRQWRENHARYCDGSPVPLALAYKFPTDCLVLTLPTRGDTTSIGRWSFSPTLVTVAEALLAGASNLLELEAFELAAFVRPASVGDPAEQIVIYETVPGGAGYVEEMARRLPEVAAAAQRRLYGHVCSKACYLCLKHYRNQRWHAFFDKDRVRDVLMILSRLEPVEPRSGPAGSGMEALRNMLRDRTGTMEPGVEQGQRHRVYPKGAIEEPLAYALSRITGLPAAQRDHEVRDGDRIITVPDFAWTDVKVAVYCDGYGVHGNPDTLNLDARKRNWLITHGWGVLTYWGRTILRDADGCARQIAELHRQRSFRN